MDQVSLTDLDGTLGLGGFRYALVMRKVFGEHWIFVPLKTLGGNESNRAFKGLCLSFTKDIASFMMCCDARRLLIRACDNHNVSRGRPPPGRPQANGVIERKIGFALEGLRALLVIGCTPDCF